MSTKSNKKSKKWFFIIGIPVMMIVLLLLGKRILFPPYMPSAPSGNLTISQTFVTWTDEARVETFRDDGSCRWLNVDFYYPEDAVSQDTVYPLVLFSHGAFGIGLSNYSTYTELASHGYIVASITHPYHAAYCESADGQKAIVSGDFINQIFRNQGNAMDKEEYLNTQAWMELRRKDIHFVLNTILEKQEKDEDFYAAIDSEHIGIMGHSLGGASAVLIGRERTDIDAVIDLDGTALGEVIGFENGEPIYRDEPYPLPLLNVYGADHWEMAQEYTSKYGDYINFTLDENALCGYHTAFSGAGHMNFTDLPFFSPILASALGVGDRDPKECIDILNRTILAFFDCYLKGEGRFSVSPNL